MQRRTFLRAAGAAAALPVLPLPVSSAPAASVPASQFNWAALCARAHAKASPAMIQSWLDVGPAQAKAVMSDLIRRQVVNAPVAGTAAAVQPMYQTRAVPTAQTTATKVKDFVKDVVRDAIEQDDAEPASPPNQPLVDRTTSTD